MAWCGSIERFWNTFEGGQITKLNGNIPWITVGLESRIEKCDCVRSHGYLNHQNSGVEVAHHNLRMIPVSAMRGLITTEWSKSTTNWCKTKAQEHHASPTTTCCDPRIKRRWPPFEAPPKSSDEQKLHPDQRSHSGYHCWRGHRWQQ